MTEAERPYTLVAELTYRCPLRCVYCSNPLDYARHGDELDTATWRRVLGEPLRAVRGTVLLVGAQHQDESAPRRRVCYEVRGREQHGGDGTLHVHDA